MSEAISVFIVDDSAVVRSVLTEVFTMVPGFRVAGTAPDPLFALEKMPKDWPDVIVLDIEMPRMDGITFLKKLMAERPTPVVICSTLTEKGADVTVLALGAGAVDVITKPQIGLKDFLKTATATIAATVRAAAAARLPAAAQRAAAPVIAAPLPATLSRTTEQVLAIGTSTGGTQALERVLPRLPDTAPGVLVVQHMPEKFTAAFAARLNALCACEVIEAKDGDRVLPGRVLIAPGGRHMQLRRSGARYHVAVSDGPRVNRHKPSVDVLFRSVARIAGRNAVGVIMTGMGDDGANALLEMREAGAHTIAQDRETSVVWGMPGVAVERGAAVEVLPLERIAQAMLAAGSGEPQARRA